MMPSIRETHYATHQPLSWARAGTHSVRLANDAHLHPVRQETAGECADLDGVDAVAWLKTSEDKGKLGTADSDAFVRVWEVKSPAKVVCLLALGHGFRQ